MNLSEPFIRRPVATALIMSALALLGMTAFPFLPIAPLPQVDFPTVQVTATLAGASAETMASSVAAPLERQFTQIAGITQMTSLSALGVTQVVVQFDLNRNVDLAAQDIQAAITSASKFLPQAMTQPPNYKKVNPADAPIIMLWAHSDTLPLTEVHDYLDNFFIPALSQLPGVAQASIIGDQKPSIRVQLDPVKLASIGLTLEEVRTKLVNATSNAAKGTIFTPKVGYTISADDQITEAGPFDDVILAYRNGATLRVRDVGQTVIEATSRYVAGFPNNKPGILLSVKKLPGANVIDTVELIKARLPKLMANIPPAMKVDTLLDRTVTIRASVRDVEFTLVLTICLVVLVVLLFLRSFWATFIPGITVPLALLGAFAAMYALNFSLDNISLMGLTIAVGFVVDDAIVVVENIHRHVEDGMTPFEAALAGSREIAFTVVSISVSLVAVFIPLLLMGGIIGRVFREFALTVTASVVVSAFVSLTLAPMLSARFMRPRSTDQPGRLYRAIERGFDAMLAGYRRTLDIALRHQAIMLCVFLATVAATVVMAYQIPKGFFPIQDTGLISGVSEASQEVSPQEMMRLQRELGAIILRDPDVQAIGSQTGSTDSPNPANTGSFTIVLKPRDQRAATARQVIDRLRPQFAQVPGANVFLQPTQDLNVGARLGRGSYQYTLQDPDIGELIEWSQTMLRKLRTLPQLADVSSDLLANAPQLRLAINRDQAARFGISPQLIDDTLNDAYGQRQITQYYTQLNTYFIILEILPDLQADVASLDRLYVKSPLTNGIVPLSSLVDSDSSRAGALSITHQGQFPSVTLTFNLRPGVALGQAVDAVTQAAETLGMPPQILSSFQGDAEAFKASLASTPALVLAALVVVYIILGILYESLVHPLTILSTLPSAAIGALLALRFGGMDLGVIGIIGIILLIGIVKKNGIILVDFAISAERDRHMPAIEAIRDACLLRFRPIMMTTAAALLAGVPLALGNGIGSELRQPLGYAMVGGLALSQLLTLYTTPVIYLYLDRLRSLVTRRRRVLDESAQVRAVAAE